jgi:molybdopterin-guanine dinucleotide biosynthesis protein A
MGRDKAGLPFGDVTMLERVVGIVASVVDEVWVVAREGQDVPGNFPVAVDAAEGKGPLAGLCAGLEAMSADRAFLTSCDAPLLRAAYVERLFALAGDAPIAIPRIGEHFMVTSAVYRREVLDEARRLVSADRLRPIFLLEAFDARVIEAGELLDVDPELQSLRNCNSPEAYREALREAGLG